MAQHTQGGSVKGGSMALGTVTGTMMGTMQGFGTPIGSADATAMTFGIAKGQMISWAVLTTFVPSDQHTGDINKLLGNSYGLYRGLAFITYIKYISDANARKLTCQELMATSLTTVLPLTTSGDYVRLDYRSRLQTGSTEEVDHLDFIMLGAPLRLIQGLEGEIVLLLGDSQNRTLLWEAPHRPGTFRGPMKLLDLRCDSCTTVPREHHLDVVFCHHGNVYCYPMGSSRCRRLVNFTIHGSFAIFVHYDRLDCQLYVIDKSDLRLIFRFDAWLESQKVIKLNVPNNRNFKPTEVATLDNVLIVTAAQFTVCAVVDKKQLHVLQLLNLHSEEIISDEPITKMIGRGLAIDADLGILFIGCVTNINQSSISILYLDEDTDQLVDLATIMSPCLPKCMAFFRQQGLLVIVDELDSKIVYFMYLNYDLFKARLEEQKRHERAIRLQLTGFSSAGVQEDSAVIDSKAAAHFVPTRVFPVRLDD